MCSTCALHKAEAYRGFMSEGARAAAIARHAAHMRLHESERGDFTARSAQCKQHPQYFALLHFDYTRACKVPSFMPGISILRRATPMQLMIGAVMSMSDGINYLFTHTAGIPKGGNLICTILYHCVRAMYSSGGVHTATRWLQCQCDGGSENINRTVLAFFATLVRYGWVTQVTIHRMVVGHTHSTVDQLFHAIRSSVRRQSIETFYDALKLMQDARTDSESNGTHILVWVHRILDWDAWFADHFVAHMHGIRKALVIRISASRLPGSPPIWRWKERSTDLRWLGEGPGDAIADMDVLASEPPGQPLAITDRYQPSNKVIHCLDVAKAYVKDAQDAVWLEAMKRGSSAIDLRIMDDDHEAGAIGQPAMLSCGTKRIQLRCLNNVPDDMWLVPPQRLDNAQPIDPADDDPHLPSAQRPIMFNRPVPRPQPVIRSASLSSFFFVVVRIVLLLVTPC